MQRELPDDDSKERDGKGTREVFRAGAGVRADDRAGKRAVTLKRNRKETTGMPREKEGYLDNLIRLQEKFPDRELLRIGEVCAFCGITNRTAKKMFPFKNNYISLATLARCLAV